MPMLFLCQPNLVSFLWLPLCPTGWLANQMPWPPLTIYLWLYWNILGPREDPKTHSWETLSRWHHLKIDEVARLWLIEEIRVQTCPRRFSHVLSHACSDVVASIKNAVMTSTDLRIWNILVIQFIHHDSYRIWTFCSSLADICSTGFLLGRNKMTEDDWRVWF